MPFQLMAKETNFLSRLPHLKHRIIRRFDPRTAAVQRVVAFQARQGIGGSVAGDDVVQHVAGAADCRRTGQGEVFDVIGERVGDGGIYEVYAFARVHR